MQMQGQGTRDPAGQVMRDQAEADTTRDAWCGIISSLAAQYKQEQGVSLGGSSQNY